MTTARARSGSGDRGPSADGPQDRHALNADTGLRDFTVELPLPPKALSSNARVHWAVRARATKGYRETCGLILRAARPKDWPAKARVVVDFEYRCFRNCDGLSVKDSTNALHATKALFDAMADAGIIPSDAKKWLALGEVRLLSTARETKKRAGVFLRVRLA